MFALDWGCFSLNTALCWERILGVPAKLRTLTSSVLVLFGLGSLVVRDAPHHAWLVASHLGFGCRVGLERLSGFNDIFLGLYDLFLGFGRGFGCRGLLVGWFHSPLGFLFISIL